MCMLFSGRLMKMLLFLFFVAAIHVCCTNNTHNQRTKNSPVSRQHFVVKVGHCEMTAPNQPGVQQPMAASATACNAQARQRVYRSLSTTAVVSFSPAAIGMMLRAGAHFCV